MDGNTFNNCIAICEVVNSSQLKRHGTDIMTLTNPDHVCTRFLFAYDHSSEQSRNTLASSNVRTTDPQFSKQLTRIMERYIPHRGTSGSVETGDGEIVVD